MGSLAGDDLQTDVAEARSRIEGGHGRLATYPFGRIEAVTGDRFRASWDMAGHRAPPT